MIRRLRKGESPFKPDRDHLHHILMRGGFSAREALVIIICLASILSTIGYTLLKAGLSEWNLMLVWLALFGVYSAWINHAWGLSKIIKKVRLKNPYNNKTEKG